MDLEILLRQYDSTLNEYKQLNSEYLDYIKNNTDATMTKDFISIDNYKINNSSSITSSTKDNVDDCKAVCASTSLCTGATYKNDKTCELKSGDNEIIAEQLSKAIITKKKKYLFDLKELNNILISLNDKIQKNINENKKNIVDDLDNKEVNLQSLKNNLIFLKNEKGNIADEIKQIEELDNKINQGSMLVEQYRSILYFLGIIFLFIVFYVFFQKIDFSSLNFNIFNNEKTS
jgi:hypothetical protein